jgi:aerobic carbon-monoxide dehydrogenase large subunit
VWTAADVTDIPPIDFRVGHIEQLEPHRQPILAKDHVRYVGEPVAVVFATDPYLAEDAAELVALELEELPAVVDAGPHALDASQTTTVTSVRKEYGDVEVAFAMAQVFIALDLSIGRHSGVPLETRRAIALRCGARYPDTLWGRQGATRKPQCAGAHAWPGANEHPPPRGSCGWGLWCPR